MSFTTKKIVLVLGTGPHKSNKISILRFGMVDVCLPLIDYNGLQYCSIGDAII